MNLLTEIFATEIKPFLGTPAVEVLKEIFIFSPDDKDLLSLKPENSILVGNNTSLDIISDIIYSRNTNHFVQKDREDFFFELFASALLLKKPNLFLKNKLLFFFSKNSNPFTSGILEEKIFRFTNSAEKPKLIDQLEHYLKGIKIIRPFIVNILTIADELISNALFNSPTNIKDEYIYRNLDRKSYVSFPQPKEARLLLTYNNDKFFISCEDPYGSLTKSVVKNRLFELYYKNNTSPIEGNAGRGLGFKIITDNSCSTYFIAKKNLLTTVCCSIPLGLGKKIVSETPKNIHLAMFEDNQ